MFAKLKKDKCKWHLVGKLLVEISCNSQQLNLNCSCKILLLNAFLYLGLYLQSIINLNLKRIKI